MGVPGEGHEDVAGGQQHDGCEYGIHGHGSLRGRDDDAAILAWQTRHSAESSLQPAQHAAEHRQLCVDLRGGVPVVAVFDHPSVVTEADVAEAIDVPFVLRPPIAQTIVEVPYQYRAVVLQSHLTHHDAWLMQALEHALEQGV